jgi:hypothetical protein
LKIRNRILYYSVLSVIILYAAYNFVQKAVISPIIRKNLVERISPLLKADSFDIEDINLSLKRLKFRNILYEKDNTKIIIERLDVDFSLSGSFINLIKLKGWFFEAESVVIKGCDIVIDPDVKFKPDKPWEFRFEDFKTISSFLKEYDFIKSISISDMNLIYSPDLKMEVISGMRGSAHYTEAGDISFGLDGKFINSEKENIFLKGFLNNTDFSADIDLNFESGELDDFKSPFGFYEIKKGNYSGGAKLEINRSGDHQLDLTGQFRLSELDADFGGKVFLTGTDFDLSYYNGMILINRLNGKINGISYGGKGKIFNILYPGGDIFFDIENISGSEIKKALNMARLDKNFYENITIGDDNSLALHITGDFKKPAVNYKINVSSLAYKNNIARDIDLEGRYAEGEIQLKKGSLSAMNSILSATGSLTNVYSKKPGYKIAFKSTGALFSNFSFINSAYLKDQSTIIEGTASGLIGDFPSVKAELTAFDFINGSTSGSMYCGLNIRNGQMTCTVSDPGRKSVLEGTYGLSDKTYSLKGKDLMKFYRIIYGHDLMEKEDSLYFELNGNDRYLALKTGSDDKNSLFYGQLDAKFDLTKDTLQSFVKWIPRKSNILSRPSDFKFTKAGDFITVSDIFFDSNPVRGLVTLNVRDKAISGQIESQNMDFGKFFGIKGLSTNTDLVLKLKGLISAPYIDFFVNENILKFYDEEKDSLIVSGEAEIHLENRKLRLEKVFIYEGLNKIVTLSGTVRDFRNVDISAYGNITADYFNAFISGIKLKGDISYKIDLTGKTDDLRIKNSDIVLMNGSVNGDRINKFEFLTSELDSSGVMVKKLYIDGGKYLNLTAEGFIPYDPEDEMYVTGDFFGDFISYADKKTKMISKGSSECEGKFTVEGKFRKPKLKQAELYILDGKFTPKGSYDGFENIRSKIFLDENLNIDIVKFKMRSSYTDGTITVENSRNNPDYGDIILPGGFNLGHLALKFSSDGIDYHAFNMMLPKDFGNFVLKGKNDNKFRIYKNYGGIVLDGKVFLRNTRITYPFIFPEKKEDGSADKKKLPSENFFSRIFLDIEVIPAAGNTYFFNLDSEEKSLWDRFVRSFSQLDNELSNVNIGITPASKGLTIKGPVNRPKEIEIMGDITGKNGTCNYSAFSFKVDNVSIMFDGKKNDRGQTDPYLRASAVTTIKTKIDSTGFSAYENVYLKAVTKEDGQVTDGEGARISELSVILTDEYGNPWFDNDEKIFEIDTRGTAQQLFVEAVDTKFLSPFLSPIETALGRFLGAQVSIRPTISGNFMNSELGVLEMPENYAEYFIGSEFYISKFLTDDIALTWNSKYIGSEEYTEITERDYGYKNKLSLDYRLNNYLFSSAGYQYDSIKDEYGYNVALTYRYRFMNISEPYNYLKDAFLKLR